MRTKIQIGIALSRRESAKSAFKESQKIFKNPRFELVVEKNLELNHLQHRKEFLKSDVFFVFGGDGSFLKVCQAISSKTPVYGIGCGERNYLSQIPCHQAAKGIQEILGQPLQSESKTRLDIEGIPIPILNELVICPEHSATVMHYEIFVNQKRLWHDYSDGVLISTPTGSSAYNAAAGGPYLLDHTKAVVITSLHSIEKRRPVVVSEDAVIHIKKIHCLDQHIQLVLDAQQRTPLTTSEIILTKSNSPVFLGTAKPPHTSPDSQTMDQWSPSSRFVFALIRQHGAMTQGELQKATGLNLRTIRRAVKQLLNAQAVTKRPFGRDQRQDLYHLL